MSAVLLCIAVLAAFLPDAIAAATGDSAAAWHYVMAGAESASLWLMIGVASDAILVRAIAAWGFIEAAERPVCRLAFPMDRAVNLAHGQHLCDAATGAPVTVVSVLAALFVALLVRSAHA